MIIRIVRLLAQALNEDDCLRESRKQQGVVVALTGSAHLAKRRESWFRMARSTARKCRFPSMYNERMQPMSDS